MPGPPTPSNPHRQASIESLRRAKKLAQLIRVRDFRRALRSGTAASVEHGDLPLLARAKTVIDVGAHKGQFAVIARHRYPHAQIHCFEPLPEPREKLANLFAKDPMVRIHPVAAWDSAGSVPMHVSKFDDSSSLLPIGDRYVASFPGTEAAGTTEVRKARIDEVLKPGAVNTPALMKVDIQGAELEALIGARQTLQAVDQILVEVSFMMLYPGQTLAAGIVSHLHETGFELSGCFGVKRNRIGQCIQADFLFDRTQDSKGL